MHSAHTHGPGCAHAARALRPSHAHSAVSSPPPVTIQKFVLQLNPYRAPCRACCNAPTPCCKALLRRIAAPRALCRNAKPAPPVTIQTIVSRHTPLARPHARTAAHPCTRADRVVALLAVSWGHVTRLLAVSWPPTALPCALCHDIIYCIVTQT